MAVRTAPSPVMQSWVGDYLRDPGGTALALLTALRDWALTWGPVAVPALAVALAGGVAARRWWRARRHAALLADARRITVLAPPTVDPAGGAAVWSNLVGLLRPAWRRLWP
jgi:hypothetical protein